MSRGIEMQIGVAGRVSVDTLKTLPGLDLTYDKEFLDDLMRSIEHSIKQYGKLLKPIIMSSDAYILDGNAVVTAAKRAGYREVDVYVVPITCKGNETTCVLLYHVLNTLHRDPQQLDQVSRRRALYLLVLAYLANQAEDEYERLVAKMKNDSVPMEVINHVRSIAPLRYTTVYYDLLLFIVHPKLFEGLLQVRERGVNSVLASIPDEVFATTRSEVERLKEIPREEREKLLRKGTKPQPKIVREIQSEIAKQSTQVTPQGVSQPVKEKAAEEVEEASLPSFAGNLTFDVGRSIEELAPNLVNALRARLSYKRGVELDWRVIKSLAHQTRDVERITELKRDVFIYGMEPIAVKIDDELDALRRAILMKFMFLANNIVHSFIYTAAGPKGDTKKAKLVLYKIYKSLTDVANVIDLKPEEVPYLVKLWLTELAVLLYEDYPELARALRQDLEIGDRVYRRLRDEGEVKP